MDGKDTLVKILTLIISIICLVVGSFFAYFGFNLFLNSNSNDRIIVFPFFICFIITFIVGLVRVISSLLKFLKPKVNADNVKVVENIENIDYKLKKISLTSQQIQVIVFMLFYFIGLIYAGYNIIKDWHKGDNSIIILYLFMFTPFIFLFKAFKKK